MNRSSAILQTCPRWLFPLVSILMIITSARISAATPRVLQTPTTQQPDTIQVSGIPNLPDLVTVVPFCWKENETEEEKTRVAIPADVDGHRGIFLFDLGAPNFILNRTFLRPSLAGGVDTVLDADTTDTHRSPQWNGLDSAHVKLRIGTLQADVEEIPVHPNPLHINAYLDHEWDNFSGDFAPKLGHISLSALESFETIIDYTHKRIVLIRLDEAGHRMAAVPAYAPRWTAPLIDMARWSSWPQLKWWGIAVRQNNSKERISRSGPATPFGRPLREIPFLDTINAANNTKLTLMDTGAPHDYDSILGYPFLSHFGVVGFNHRTHQFILYR